MYFNTRLGRIRAIDQSTIREKALPPDEDRGSHAHIAGFHAVPNSLLFLLSPDRNQGPNHCPLDLGYRSSVFPSLHAKTYRHTRESVLSVAKNIQARACFLIVPSKKKKGITIASQAEGDTLRFPVVE